jgi:hypothetical protein
MGTYEFADMPEQLLDFALSLTNDFTIDLFDGGLIARADDLSIVATINPLAIADDAETCSAVELAVADASSVALRTLGLADMDAEWIEDTGLNDDWPDLEFMVLRPAEAAA